MTVVAALLLCCMSVPVSAATGRFDLYCDAVGITLDKVEGATTSKKMMLFSYLDFPPGTMRGVYLGQGKWHDVTVHRAVCAPDRTCESLGHGRVWIDNGDESPGHAPKAPATISGKYEIEVNGKKLVGPFTATQHRTWGLISHLRHRYPQYICE